MKWNRWQDLHVKDIAIVIIFLLMMLPVTSSNAFAASINSADAYGSYGVKGYRAGTDTIFLNVSAVITEDSDVGPNQLKIIEDPTRPFDCTLIDPATLTYNCIVKYPESTLPAGYPTMTFSVQVVSDAGVAISPVRQGSLIVDSLPPVMVDIDYNVLDSGVVEATGTFEDKACDGPGCTEKCSGIKSIEFMVESASIGKKSDFDRKSCVHKTSINLSGFIAGGDVGKKHICIEMTDNFDQKDTKCSDVFIDALKPEIKGIRIMGANNQQIRYTNGQPIFPVSIVVDLYDHSGLIDPVSGEERIIRVDASSLSEREDHQEAYKNLQSSSCTSNAENQYNCTVSGLFLIASSQKNIDIRVMANDSQGNKLNETRTLRLVFDSTPPTATRIYSSFPDAAGEFWVGEEDNVIMMDITETGSGMADMNVFLDFSQLNTALGLVHPNECIAGWTCKWRYIDVKIPSGSVVSLTPKGESADDTGNFLQGGQGTLRVDVDPPEIDDALRAVSNITAIGEGHNPWLDITGGDILEIHLFVKDHSGIKSAMANFSDIIEDGLESVVGVCEEHQILPGVDETIFECIWATEPVLEGYRKDLEIIFTFEDYVNHTYEYTWDGIEILQKENVSTPTWLIEYEDSSPSQGMDRLSWRLAQPRMFFRHKFTSLRGSHVYPASIVLDPQTCTNLEYVTVDPLTNEISIKMMDYPGYYTRPEPPFEDITEIQFNPEAVPEAEYMDANNLTQPLEEFEIDCAVIITSIVDFGSTKSLTMPEIVNISFPVKVYNNKMGQNIGNINDEIAEMEKHIKAFRWLTIMRQIFQIAENICDMISTLIRIDGMIAAAKDIFQTACNANTAACSVNAGMAKILSDDTEALMEFVQGFYHFCELFISCRGTNPEELETDCPDTSTDDVWCKIKKFWNTANTWYAGMFSEKLHNLGLNDLDPGGAPLVNTGSFDPKKSIITSILSLCIPGIIVNLEKYRQLSCEKLICYKFDVPNGKPVWQCDQKYGYDTCTFVVGQVFSAIPVAQYIEQLGQMFENVIQNPFSLIGQTIDVACRLVCELCTTKGACQATCTACRIIEWLSTATNIIGNLVESTGPRFQMATYDVCEQALAETPDRDEIKPPTPPTGVI